jgi:hypothetical protein
MDKAEGWAGRKLKDGIEKAWAEEQGRATKEG